jgi:hydroxymethylpyrimidine/phosphomethylpyrimidine kinase
VHAVPPALVRAQVASALENGAIGAVKIGMLASAATVEAVDEALRGTTMPIVLDPVLAASSGGSLLDAEGELLLRRRLIPRVTLLTPNLPEAAALLRQPLAVSEAAQLAQLRALIALGPAAVLLKGGHAPAPAGSVIDQLLIANCGEVIRLQVARVPARRRGTGCSAASAIAAYLATGKSLTEACAAAQVYVAAALRRCGDAELGSSTGA